MNEQNANLETRAQTNQPNKADNSASPSQGAAQPNKVVKDDVPDKPRTLADMFADPSDESSLEINLDDDTPDDPNAPVDSFELLMKRNKLTAEQAYAIRIPMTDGAEPLTIGELKDKIRDLANLETEQTQFDQRRIKQEGELLRSQSELKEILQLIPKEAITPRLFETIRQRQDATTRRERQLTLQHIPQWNDEKKRTADIEGLIDMLGEYGFDESFLESVTDHRALKLLRDTMIIRNRIKKSLAEVRDPQGKNKRPSNKGKGAPAKNPAQSQKKIMPTQNDKIAQLFKSKE